MKPAMKRLETRDRKKYQSLFDWYVEATDDTSVLTTHKIRKAVKIFAGLDFTPKSPIATVHPDMIKMIQEMDAEMEEASGATWTNQYIDKAVTDAAEQLGKAAALSINDLIKQYEAKTGLAFGKYVTSVHDEIVDLETVEKTWGKTKQYADYDDFIKFPDD